MATHTIHPGPWALGIFRIGRADRANRSQNSQTSQTRPRPEILANGDADFAHSHRSTVAPSQMSHLSHSIAAAAAERRSGVDGVATQPDSPKTSSCLRRCIRSRPSAWHHGTPMERWDRASDGHDGLSASRLPRSDDGKRLPGPAQGTPQRAQRQPLPPPPGIPRLHRCFARIVNHRQVASKRYGLFSCSLMHCQTLFASGSCLTRCIIEMRSTGHVL